MAALDEFISSFSQYGGPAHLNRFEVVIVSPQQLGQSDRFVSSRIETASMPGKNIRSVPNENVYGPTQEMAQGLTYDEVINMTFLLSAEHREKQFFMNWMDYIYKPKSYNLEYYDNYKRDISFWQLDKNDERTAGVKIIDCWPKTINAIEYGQGNGEIAKLTVGFAFKEHIMIDGNGNDLTGNQLPTGSFQGRTVPEIQATDDQERLRQEAIAAARRRFRRSPFGGLMST